MNAEPLAKQNTEAFAPYYIGPIRIDPPVVLAPMADVTNGAFRRIVKRIGSPGLLVTELISTTAIHFKSERTMTMFDVTPEQYPLAVQLFGSDPAIMAEAARVAVGEGADIIDINMGCWVPKVCKTGGGAAMMRDEATACRVMAAIVAAVDVPVTVKTRAGWDYGHLATAGLAKRLEEAGAAGFAPARPVCGAGPHGKRRLELNRGDQAGGDKAGRRQRRHQNAGRRRPDAARNRLRRRNDWPRRDWQPLDYPRHDPLSADGRNAAAPDV